jgi:hypothetical protein
MASGMPYFSTSDIHNLFIWAPKVFTSRDRTQFVDMFQYHNLILCRSSINSIPLEAESTLLQGLH